MDNPTISNSFVLLLSRLSKVEGQLKLLTKEVGSIKNELATFTTSSPSNKATIKEVIEIDGTNFNEVSDPKRPRLDNFIMEGDYVVVFTDGACENNGKVTAKAGIGAWFGRDHHLNISKPVNGRPTNNVAEIQACVEAIKVAHKNGIRKLKIKTDSQFVINSITKWIHKWKKNNWRVVSGQDVKNKEDFVVLDSAIGIMDSVIWEHVDGHKGIVGNEYADQLARAGASRYK